ncbi:MAG: hypothetical protein P4K93_06700 [Terracidiphilus sp.]|nr:hypothetical protein [Terracidiphilus sp.]MDR3797823.1 hypothetical protein [Terracidiphilus sp.]
MNWEQDVAGESPELEQALKHFKSSVDAWSDAAYSRPRTAAKLVVRHSRRMVAGWALGCVVVMGSLAGAVGVVVHRQEMARIAAQKAAEQRAAAAQGTTQPASVQPVSAQSDKKTPAATDRKVGVGAQDSARSQDEDLLASVDSDVSRQVPTAMEPLAQLMDDNGTQ